jgi:hypothetical protein
MSTLTLEPNKSCVLFQGPGTMSGISGLPNGVSTKTVGQQVLLVASATPSFGTYSVSYTATDLANIPDPDDGRPPNWKGPWPPKAVPTKYTASLVVRPASGNFVLSMEQPYQYSLMQGATANSALIIDRSGASLQNQVTLSCSVSGSGVIVTPAPLPPVGATSNVQAFQIHVAPNAPTTNVDIHFTATGVVSAPGQPVQQSTQSLDIPVTVTPWDCTITPSTINIPQSGLGQQITVGMGQKLDQPTTVVLSVPPGIVATPSSFTLSPGQYSQSVTLTASGSTPPGNSQLTATFTSGFAVKQASCAIGAHLERVILHLSDLHIGANDNDPGMSGTALNQAQQIVNSILKTYASLALKPVVMVTGDIVDYASGKDATQFVAQALALLQTLKQNGYTVLVTPGNHDYSDAVDLDSINWIVNGFTWAAGEKDELIAFATSRGSSPHLVSGSTYTQDAVKNFNAFAEYMYGGGYTESWKDKGAAFDLEFILVDGQDRNPNPPNAMDRTNMDDNPIPGIGLTIAETELLEIDTKFFMHNKYLRLAHGYVDTPTYNSWNGWQYRANQCGALSIVGLHYWVNYWCRNLLSNNEATAVGILALISGVDFGSLPPANQLTTLCAARLNNPNFSNNVTGSLWNDIGVPVSDNPEPVPWSNISKLLDNTHLLLVGHRHIGYDLQDIRQALANLRDEWRPWLAAANKAKSAYQGQTLTNRITTYIRSICQLLPSMAQYNSQNTTDSTAAQKLVAAGIAAAVQLVQNTDISFDLDARYNQMQQQAMLGYYHEAGSSLPDPSPGAAWNAPRQWTGSKNGINYLSWSELRMNLNTGEVTCKQINC